MRPSVRSSCLLIICLITVSLFGVLLASVQKNTAASPAIPLTQVSQPAIITPPPITPMSEYHIGYFKILDEPVPAENCHKLAYWVVGASRLILTGSVAPDAHIQLTDNPNTRTVCLTQIGNAVEGTPIVYTLDIVYLDGRTETRSVTAP